MKHDDIIAFVKTQIDLDEYPPDLLEEIQCYTWEEWKDYINENVLHLDKFHQQFFNWNNHFEYHYQYDASQGGREFYLVKCDKWNKDKVVLDEPHDKVDMYGSLYWVVSIPVS
jgi:hypothetical protein